VFVGCGVGFRAEALHDVGGLDRSFFMQAEEYDLSFRLVVAEWRVEVFEDLHVEHLKTNRARRSDRTTYYDVRNNLRVVARYLPSPYDRIYREDWTQRYGWLAEREDHTGAYVRGRRAGRRRALWERWTHRRHRFSPSTFEHFFQWDEIERRMGGLRELGVNRVLFADLGKNVYAFYRAARRMGVEVVAIADDRFSAPQRCYRGVPVVPLEDALRRDFDAIVVSNTSAVHAAATRERFHAQTHRPVFDWFGSSQPTAAVEFRSSLPAPLSDDIPAERACSLTA
jgi:hypothetical protein